jgi:UDP-GlcNAc:undecaprenyl-phosphate GlcNAc-1-phosphate transferase
MTADDLIWLSVGAVAPGLVVSWLATSVMRRLAPRMGLVDEPGVRKVHRTRVALGGGVAVFLGVVVPFAIGTALLQVVNSAGADPAAAAWVPDIVRLHQQGLNDRIGGLWVLLGCAGILVVLGLLDDRFGLPWPLRLAVELGVALFCVWHQGWQLTAFINLPSAGWLVSMALSTVWIVALINSFNMLDNMDGLSAGVAAIASGMLAVVLMLSPDPETQRPQLFVAGLLLMLLGSLLGFLVHNWPPARIFMGDAGSYFVGFYIAVATLLATYTSYTSHRPYAVAAPLCVMAVPLYDMVTVLYIRWREGRSWFHGDKSHFSHRLVDLGFSEKAAVLTIYLMSATCGLGALLLHRVDWLGAGVILVMILCVLALIALLESTARRRFNNRGGAP